MAVTQAQKDAAVAVLAAVRSPYNAGAVSFNAAADAINAGRVAIVAAGVDPSTLITELVAFSAVGSRAGPALKAAIDAVNALVPDSVPPVPDPIPVPPARIQLDEGANTGPSWVYANRVLQWAWNTPGGDYVAGLTQTFTVTDETRPVVFDVTAILKARTDGFLVHPTTGGPKFYTRVSATPPTLSVVTDKGSFACPCIINGFLDPSAGGFLNGDDGTANQGVGLFKFDLSAVAGSIQSATFTLTLRRYGAGAVIACECLDMPVIPDYPMVGPSNQADILDLEMTDLASLVAAAGGAGNMAQPWAYNPEFAVDPNGMKYLRFSNEGAGGNARLIDWFIPIPACDSAYCRYCIYIESDVRTGFNELGMKLPGLSNINSTPTELLQYNLEHGRPAPNNDDIYGLTSYFYDQSSGPGFGQVGAVGVLLRANRWYCIEEYINVGTPGVADGLGAVKINGHLVYEFSKRLMRKGPSQLHTLDVLLYHGGTAHPIGPMHYRIAKVAVGSSWIGVPQELLGAAPPVTPPVVTPPVVTPPVIPPPVVTPPPGAQADGSILLPFQPTDAWWNALPLNQVVEVPNTALATLPMPSGFVDFGSGQLNAVMLAWSGAAFDDAAGDYYCNGGGHEDGSNNGLFKFALGLMKWSIAMAPTMLSQATLDAAKAAWNAHSPPGPWISLSQGINAAGQPDYVWPDGKPTAQHTYRDLVWTGTEVLRGGFNHVWHYKNGVATPGTETFSEISDAISFWDKQNKVMIRCKTIPDDYWDVRTYDPVTRLHTLRPLALNLAPSSTYWWIPGAADLIGREIIDTDGTTAFAMNVDTWTSRPITVPTPLGELSLRGGAGTSRGLEFPGVSGKLYIFNPATGTFTAPPQAGVFAPPAITTQQGIFGRFRRYLRGSVEVLALLPSTAANVRLIRIA